MNAARSATLPPQQRPFRINRPKSNFLSGICEKLPGELARRRIELPPQNAQVDMRLAKLALRALETKPKLRFQQARAK